MKIEMRSIDSITPYERNPRQNDGAVDAVADSIREFGWRVPLVVDEQGVIVAGIPACWPPGSSASRRCPCMWPRV